MKKTESRKSRDTVPYNYREISYIFLPQLISYISHISYSKFQRVHGEILKKSGC
jgi:hypothetical protein